jgi:hypothetical protein
MPMRDLSGSAFIRHAATAFFSVDVGRTAMSARGVLPLTGGRILPVRPIRLYPINKQGRFSVQSSEATDWQY